VTIDPVRPAAAARAAEYCRLPRPLFTKLPFDYRIVPARARTAILSLLARLPGPDRGFPNWPIERSIDEPAAATAGRSGRATFLITHDLDTAVELDLIEPIRAFERGLGMVSSWGFVPEITWPTEDLVRTLVAESCEAYWHDIHHDGKLAYQAPEAIRMAFARVDARSPWAMELLRSFRSGQLLMSEALMAALSERFDVDLSIPDTERGGPYGAIAGCGTVIPFLIGPILEIPLSLPQDVFLEQVYRLSPDERLGLWQAKIEHVVSVGGVAVLNTHPKWVNPARPEMWAIYVRLLEWVAGRTDVTVSTPLAVRESLMGRPFP
jgi:hypothetical protein